MTYYPRAMETAQQTFKGACHCGRIAFEVTEALEAVSQCNCSICTKKGYLHWIVPRESFRLLTPDAPIATYTFNTGVAKHHFCPNCGVAPYYIPRSDPDQIDVNARCLDEVDLSKVKLTYYDGQNWEKSYETYRRERAR